MTQLDIAAFDAIGKGYGFFVQGVEELGFSYRTLLFTLYADDPATFARRTSASRSFGMIASGVRRFRFMMSLFARFPGSRDSHDDWGNFRGQTNSTWVRFWWAGRLGKAPSFHQFRPGTSVTWSGLTTVISEYWRKSFTLKVRMCVIPHSLIAATIRVSCAGRPWTSY